MCFEPHHALRVIADGHTYDYLLCYSCNGIVVFEDSKRIADLSISGSPDILNALLTTAHVPLSYIYSPQYITAEKKRMQDEKDADARWLAAMPTSFQPLWAKAAQEMFFKSTPPPRYNPDNSVSDRRHALLEPFHTALDEEFPDTNSRILALLKWYGSGAGPWSGFPAYESYAAGLLFDYPSQDILAAIQNTKLTEEQTEGLARFFGEDIALYQPEDLNFLSPELKRRLLEHSLKSTNSDKTDRAKRAFGER